MIADLHCHTTASDGTYAPEKLVLAAHRKKINLFSVTDHDTIAALPQLTTLCAEKNIRLIPGIEISCHCQEEEVHILAYAFDPDSPLLSELIEKQKQDRIRRLKDMLLHLEKANVFISWEEVQRHIHSKSAAGRPHVARALVYKGYASSLHDAFFNYLTPGKAGYVPRQKVPAEFVLDLISKINGISVLAHPGLLKNQKILEDLYEQGLQGIEVYHPSHKAWQKTYYAQWADDQNLFVTGGSDFHGDKMKGHGALGSMKIPEIHVQKFLEEIS